MILSEISVRRPVFATVISLLLVTIGVVSFTRLPLREYPDINPPIVSVDTRYTGASAQIIETKVTQVIEDAVAGIEGIKTIESSSQDGRSRVTIEFKLSRDIDAASNDVRDRISRVIRNLPEEADPPQISKVDTNTDAIMWLNLSSDVLNELELSDFANRYLVDRLSVVDGVAQVRIGGERRYAMRIWLDRIALAARGLTVNQVENVLRRENVELPAGRIESQEREFTVRVERSYASEEDFREMVIGRGSDGHLIRLGEVARVEIGAENHRSAMRGNGRTMIGLGIVRQSTANTLEVSRGVRQEVDAINESLPEHLKLQVTYDSSIFIEKAVDEVYETLAIAMVLVILVIYLFLGNLRSTLIPAVTVPVSLIASSIVLLFLGYSINLLTLLALVLAIGLVVDDAIIMLENISRRIELGEPPLLAAYRGSRQVGFAIIATTAVLVSVFIPIAFLEGNVGRLFTEFAFAMAAAVAFSAVAALTLSPMMCAFILPEKGHDSFLTRFVNRQFVLLSDIYRCCLRFSLRHPLLIVLCTLLTLGGAWWLWKEIPTEFAPAEDQGSFYVRMQAPEGASYEYSVRYMQEIENILLPYQQNGEIRQMLIRVPGFGGVGDAVNSGVAIVVLSDWSERERSAFDLMAEVGKQTSQLPGVLAFPSMRRGFGQRGSGQPVQFVIGGSTYEDLARWRDELLSALENYPGLTSISTDYRETKPSLLVNVDRNRAAETGVSLSDIGRALESLLGSRKVTTYIDRGEEYDVILQARDSDRETVTDLTNIYVESSLSGELVPLSNLVEVHERAESGTLNRYNRLRSVTLSANLAEGYRLGDVLDYLDNLSRETLPETARIDYKGESLELRESGSSMIFTFAMALLVVYLVLAAQFESFIHPFIILLTVPLAVTGALLGLWLTNSTLNIYSEIGIVMLVGLAAKNGILIVEFANQLRDRGIEFHEALMNASMIRLRPIVMTAVSTIIGAVPLVLATGAGMESRITMGVVVFFGMLISSLLTIFVIPVFYLLLGRFTSSPLTVTRAIEALETKHEDRG